MIDLNFFYKYSIRSVVFYKLDKIINTYNIPKIYKYLLFFSLVNIADLDMVQCYNYAYLYKFFFGRKAYFTKQRSFFNLGK